MHVVDYLREAIVGGCRLGVVLGLLVDWSKETFVSVHCGRPAATQPGTGKPSMLAKESVLVGRGAIPWVDFWGSPVELGKVWAMVN